VGDGLAVCTPVVGLASETFVARHATLLAPGRTLTVTTGRSPAGPATWSVEPVLRLPGRRPPGRAARTLRGGWARATGTPAPRWRWQPSARDLTELAHALDAHGVGVVLTEFLDTWLPLVPWFLERGVRVVAHSHGRDVSVRLRDRWWRQQYAAYAEADAVVAVSEHVRRRLVDLGLPAGSVHVVPCGVDVPAEPLPPRAEDGTVRLLAVGRMVPKKAPLATVEAFALAARRDRRLRLTMVGDGPLAGAVAEAVGASGVGDRVELLGARSHAGVLDELRACDVFVQHSVVSPDDGDEEGLPVAVLESMAAARPVVSTRHAGIPEAVADGRTGLLVDEGDVAGMAAALETLAGDAGWRCELGRAGHAVAKARFSWDVERGALRALLGLGDEA
jgi:glycosyltransferase involved in cell wall biosynthesis